jgi:hypothetical protein
MLTDSVLSWPSAQPQIAAGVIAIRNNYSLAGTARSGTWISDHNGTAARIELMHPCPITVPLAATGD